MLTELARREKASNIKPDPDIDVFMKVRGNNFYTGKSSECEKKELNCNRCALERIKRNYIATHQSLYIL